MNKLIFLFLLMFSISSFAYRTEMNPSFKRFYKKNFLTVYKKDPSVNNSYFKVLEKWIGDKPVIFEAGAHNGEHTIKFAKKFPYGKIISFEPNPTAFNKLLKATKDCSNVFPFELAVNDYNGVANFFVCYGTNGTNPVFDGASSLLEATKQMEIHYMGPQITVPCVILDDWCKDNNVDHIDFMWLDLEGAELIVLKNAKEILKTVKIIYTETNLFKFRKGAAQFKTLRKFIESQGFTMIVHWYTPGLQGDAVFIKNSIFKELRRM